MKLELDAPSVGALEKEYLSRVIEEGFVSTFGPFIPELEQKLGAFLSAPACVAVQSGTAAIHMALYEWGIGPGDEVIVPALTFTATVNPILYVGAKPVIVDVDPKSWTISPEAIERAITPRTKAVLIVHLYGNPCALDQIMAICQKHRLILIEDATESLGSRFKDKATGLWGDAGCFSFNGNKMITTGGGGLLVSANKDRIEHVRYLINQAKDKHDPSLHSEMGFNYRMTNLEAGLGLAQFKRLNDFLTIKQEFKQIYHDVLSTSSRFHFYQVHPDAWDSAWLSCVSVDGVKDLSDYMGRLKSKGVPTRRLFLPLGQMPYLKQYQQSTPHADALYQTGLCLPSSTLNSKEAVYEAATIIREVFDGTA